MGYKEINWVTFQTKFKTIIHCLKNCERKKTFLTYKDHLTLVVNFESQKSKAVMLVHKTHHHIKTATAVKETMIPKAALSWWADGSSMEKSGIRIELGNYRPLSLSQVLSKLWDNVVSEQLLN